MEFTVVERCRGSLWPNRLPSCASQPPHCHTCFSLSSVVAAASTRRMSAGGGHEVSGGGCELVGVSVHVSQIAFQNSTRTPHTWELCPLTSLHSLDHAATPCTRSEDVRSTYWRHSAHHSTARRQSVIHMSEFTTRLTACSLQSCAQPQPSPTRTVLFKPLFTPPMQSAASLSDAMMI